MFFYVLCVLCVAPHTALPRVFCALRRTPRFIGCYRVFTRKPWPQSIGAPDGALSPPAAGGI